MQCKEIVNYLTPTCNIQAHTIGHSSSPLDAIYVASCCFSALLNEGVSTGTDHFNLQWLRIQIKAFKRARPTGLIRRDWYRKPC